MTKSWQHYSHEADWGVRGIGSTKEEAFEEAAIGLTALLVDPITIRADQKIQFTCEAPDDELLFVEWLNAILREMAVRKMIFGEFHVQIADGRLEAEIAGEPLDSHRHAPELEVKGATYTTLSVRREKDGTWVAQCVVDV